MADLPKVGAKRGLQNSSSDDEFVSALRNVRSKSVESLAAIKDLVEAVKNSMSFMNSSAQDNSTERLYRKCFAIYHHIIVDKNDGLMKLRKYCYEVVKGNKSILANLRALRFILFDLLDEQDTSDRMVNKNN